MEKQSKIIVVSDLHYGLGKNSKNKLKILKEYVEPAILKELSDSSYQNTLIICGDLFHEMVSVRTDIYKESRLFLERCCSTNSNVILIAGNHDCYDESTEVTSVELFDQIVDVVRYPREMTFGERKYLLLPWSDNNTYAFRYEDEKYDGVFCHPDVPKEFFSGLYVLDNNRKISATDKNLKYINDNKLISSGLDATNFSNGSENNKIVSNLETVRKLISLSKKSGEIFAGHIHKHSESYIMGRKFCFIGAPYQTTSEEINTKSGYYVIVDGKSEFHEIESPEFVKIKFSDIKKYGVEKYDFSKVTNNIVQFDGDDIIPVELEAKMKKMVLDMKPFELSDTDYSNLVIEKDVVENVEEYQKVFSSSPKKCIELYIENISDETLETEEVDRKKLLTTFGTLYDYIDKKIGIIASDGGANIKYKKLIATNFLSYETLEFDFEKYNGLTLVYGKNLDNIGATNACGKSNIIKAIVYALFGRFPKKVKKENMSPWDDSSKDVNVSIFLESNGINYRIDSGLKKGKDSYHRVFNIDEDKDISKKQLAETRKFIENDILHCGFDMFMKTTVLTSSEIFNFYCMKKEDKDDYLNTIFGTKTLNEVREQIKSHLKVNRSSYLETNRLLESKERDIELNKHACERFESNRNENISKLKTEIDSIEMRIDELKNEESNKNTSEYLTIESEIKNIESEIKKLNIQIQKTKMESISLVKDIESKSTTVKLMSDELIKHKDVITKICSDCKKTVADAYNLTDYAKSIKTSREIIKENDIKNKKCNEQILELESKRDSMIRETVTLEHKLRDLKSNSNEITKLEESVKSKLSTIQFINNQENPNVKIVDTLINDKSKIESDLNEINAKIRHLEFIQTKVVSQEVITNILTSKFIQQLNERIRYYLQRLGLNLGVEFDNEFHYEFIRGNGAHPEFNSLSGGESLRIVIATSFAFKDFLESRRNISSNIRFLDEFFEKDADNLGMNSTISILKDFSKIMNQNVFLISNKLNEIDNSIFDNILLVTIKNNKSLLNEEMVSSKTV